jgi:hypothetical protein
MSHEERSFLSLPRYPVLLELLQVCWILGLKLHQGKILVRRGLIPTVGKRKQRKGWLFATAVILEIADDPDWPNRAKDALSKYWEESNRRKKARKLAKEEKGIEGAGPRSRKVQNDAGVDH